MPETHAHPHPHGHSHGAQSARREDERRHLGLTLVLVIGVLAAEVVGGLMSHSLALLTDAVHMLTDVSALVLSLFALRWAARPADRVRTYGYHRLEILAALANGAVLTVLSAFVGYEAYKRLANPQPVHAGTAVLFAAIALVGNGTGLYFLEKSRHSLNTRAAFVHVLGDTLASVAVIVGALVMRATQWWWLDPVLSLVIGVLIIVGAVQVVREAVDVLLEGAPRHLDCGVISADLKAVDGVVAVHDLHVWTITSGMYALSAHVVVDPEALGRNDALLVALKDRLRQAHGVDHTTIQIESAAYAHPSSDEIH